MTKKIEHLTHDLQEFLPGVSSKKLWEKLWELSSLKQDFSASKSFKHNLKLRLSDTYHIQTSSGFSFISIFRFTGILASFIFVSGLTYFYYNSQQNMIDSGVPSPVENMSLIWDMGVEDVSTDTSLFQEAETWKRSDEIPPNPKASSQGIAPIWEVVLPQVQKTSTFQDTEVLPTSDVWDGWENVSSLNDVYDESWENIESMKIAPKTLPTYQDKTAQDEYIISDILSEYGDIIPTWNSLDSHWENQSNFMISPWTSRTMSDALDPFYEICASYSGTILEDNFTCQFTPEYFCTRENIFPESETKCQYLEKID
jgi:hypothetical protein